MKRLLKPYFIFVIAAFVSSGAVVSAFLEIGDAQGFDIFVVSVPRLLLLIILSTITIYYANPKLLLKGKYIGYAATIFCLCLITTILAVAFERNIKIFLGAELGPIYFTSSYIWAYIISNSILIAMLIFGLGGLALYKRWTNQVVVEKRLSECYKENSKILRSRFDTDYLLNLMDGIIRSIKSKTNSSRQEIEQLSDYLRHQLYDFPPIKSIDNYSELLSEETALSELIIAPKYGMIRWIILETLIVLVSLGAFYPSFQHSVSFNNFIGVILSIGILNLIVVANIKYLFPIFRNRCDITLYLIYVSIPVIVIGCISFIASFLPNSGQSPQNILAMSIALISSFGTTITIGLFWIGTSGFVCFQYWLRTDRRINILNTQNREIEYLALQRQLSPHFLFNVLNNIDFLSEEDSEAAIKLMKDLRNLMEYQLRESQKEKTSIKREVDFLDSYLSLEKIRHDFFDYSIDIDCNVNYYIPTLLFIPFVENAVKHNAGNKNNKSVKISINEYDEKIRFCCRNTCLPQSQLKNRPGGIGLSNTQRRLNLLFGDAYYLTHSFRNNTFTVTLEFPVIFEYEMHNNR